MGNAKIIHFEFLIRLVLIQRKQSNLIHICVLYCVLLDSHLIAIKRSRYTMKYKHFVLILISNLKCKLVLVPQTISCNESR